MPDADGPFRGKRIKRGNAGFWSLLSGLALVAHWVTYFKSIQLSTVAIGILSLHVYPVIAALAEPLFFKEPFHPIDVLMTVAVLAGIGIMVPEFSLSSQTTQGILWGIVSAVFWTARNLLSRQLVRTYSGLRVMAYQLGVCVLVPLPWVLWDGQPVSAQAWAQLALLGVIFTALPHTLFTNSLQTLTTRTVSVMATMLPIYGAVLAALVLNEIPAGRTLIGGSIVIAVVFYETWRTVRR